MAKNRGLGKGLDLIFEDNSLSDETKDPGSVKTLRISAIDPKSDQPRKNFDAESLAQLAESIAAKSASMAFFVMHAHSAESMFNEIGSFSAVHSRPSAPHTIPK
ncbi:MAG: hypothetical protein IKT25_06935, partial [Firmicutes bacterium]|nr:hypothetical protein [Bacillota bacterium]